ncbi:hypothetical protein HQN90_07450 [Paenibacillus alba]|uniref:hypothetical protein n=1 Tax=Paenibacillus alba TaxID=1197127 RepID=UPI001564CC9D|nr:hypothetical protein [Paenibacillus alba]NQX65960.1 hypothetical protein [Paenibacillus alba]
MIRLVAPASTIVSFNVMDGSSVDNAYAIEWVRREWKTDYKKNSNAGIFYQLRLEEGKDYTFITDEQLIKQKYDPAKARFEDHFTSSSDPAIPTVAKRKMTVFGPDGKEVLVDEKLAGTTPFKASSTGIYIVELQSDVKDHTTEIRVNKVD